MENTRFSVVVPIFNEQAVITAFHSRLTAVLSQLGNAWEIIYVDDGSHDQTGLITRQLCHQDARVKLLSLSRNFGHQTAITAGMDHASGNAVIIIDADLQDPPEVISEMVKQWENGFDVVYGRRTGRHGESWIKKGTARLYYRLLRRLTDVEIPVDVGDFRLIDARVCAALATLPEHNRYVRGLISWLGFRQTFVDYVRAPRYAGKTKYPFQKMLKLAIDGIMSFSYKPLKMGIGLGLVLSIFSFCFLLFVFIARLFDLIVMEPGYASLMCVMLFFFGVVLVMLGVMGEYLARVFEEVKGRPLYIIRDRVGTFNRQVRTGIAKIDPDLPPHGKGS
jgi:polyisoprenyl-phosphate glycosyltransferase